MLAYQIASGLASGAIYGALALALVMIYRSTHHINFAQGEMATFSTFLAWQLCQIGAPVYLALAISILVSFVAAAAIERLVIRRFRGAPHLTVVIVFIGLFCIFNSASGWIWDYTIRPYPSLFDGIPLPGSRYLNSHELGMIVVVGLLVLVLYLFFQRTRLGLSMRAAADNPESSRYVGISVDRTTAIGWGVSAGFGAVAGVLIAPVVYLEVNMMSGVLIYAFAAALVGGIDSPPGALIGGLIIGISENLLGAYLIGTELKLTAAFLIIIGVLLFKPDGLFGKARGLRV